MQLWSSILETVTAVGNKRNFDENGKLRKSRWYFSCEDDSSEEEKDDSDEELENPAPVQVYQTLNLTTEQLNFMK